MRQVDRRSFFRLLGLTTAGVAVAACSSGESATSEGDAAAATTGPLSGTATLTTWGSDAEVAAFNRLAAAFKEQRGADVTIEVLPYDQIRTVIDRRLQANEPPDLFRVSYTDVGSYASNGVLADLTDYLQDGFG